jgi:hypothetical protein
MNLLEFTKNKKALQENINFLYEAFNSENFDKYLSLLNNVLSKNINKLCCIKDPISCEIDEIKYQSFFYFKFENDNFIGFSLNYKTQNKSTDIYSISFYDNAYFLFDDRANKAKSIIYTNGLSIVYYIPLILHVCNTKDFNFGKKDIKSLLNDIKNIKESFRPFYVGALRYNIFENLDKESIEKCYEEMSPRLKKFKEKVYAKHKEMQANRRNDSKGFKEIWQDYEDIKQAIKGGAEDIEDIDIEFKSNVTIKILNEMGYDKLQQQIEKAKEEHQNPEEVWKYMQQYIKLVLKGYQPSLILCGAPGVGKTYRVKKQLKANGYIEGTNLWTIKGKCTPRQLYLSLYNFKDKKDIIVIDDADGLVGPKAPEDVINILKAALDSTSEDEGRLVSYGISGQLLDEDGTPIPKRFYYNGGIIVITNYSAGQLDTALRGRSFIQDINFTLEDILEIIEKLLPEIDPHILSMEAKRKAFEYLKEIAPNNIGKIEVSIRTFGICSKIFDSADDNFTDEDCKKMIYSQLKLQYLRHGKKY